MKNFLEFIIKNLASYPEDVFVDEMENGAFIELKVKLNDDDYGKVIGRNGKIIQAIRSIIRTANKDRDKRYLVKIGDEK